MKTLWPGYPHATLDLAVVFSGMGDKGNALYWLEKAQEMHVSDLIAIEQDSHFGQVRGERHFQAVVERAGTPK